MLKLCKTDAEARCSQKLSPCQTVQHGKQTLNEDYGDEGVSAWLIDLLNRAVKSLIKMIKHDK